MKACGLTNVCPSCGVKERCDAVHLSGRHAHGTCWGCMSRVIKRRDALMADGQSRHDAEAAALAELRAGTL